MMFFRKDLSRNRTFKKLWYRRNQQHFSRKVFFDKTSSIFVVNATRSLCFCFNFPILQVTHFHYWSRQEPMISWAVTCDQGSLFFLPPLKKGRLIAGYWSRCCSITLKTKEHTIFLSGSQWFFNILNSVSRNITKTSASVSSGFQTRENWWKHEAACRVLLLFSSVWNSDETRSTSFWNYFSNKRKLV